MFLGCGYQFLQTTPVKPPIPNLAPKGADPGHCTSLLLLSATSSSHSPTAFLVQAALIPFPHPAQTRACWVCLGDTTQSPGKTSCTVASFVPWAPREGLKISCLVPGRHSELLKLAWELGIAHPFLEHIQELPVPTWFCLSPKSLPLLLMALSRLGLNPFEAARWTGLFILLVFHGPSPPSAAQLGICRELHPERQKHLRPN